jgi:hypothetical protein
MVTAGVYVAMVIDGVKKTHIMSVLVTMDDTTRLPR